ncbi:MAG TPA: sulfatase-like hydrolase/transferase [Thermoanaerobaculales bacterium]|nr:sulfatase-like hydrolase/transferase [Thermoanaerobaculales bacterium]
MRRASLFFAALALLVACGRDQADRGHNLVLVTLDTTRADHLGCYGATTVQTPNLDRIAAAGTVFDRAFAVAPITAPSHASILSGTFPPFSRVRDNDVFAVPRELPWLPAILKERGYRTAGFVAAFPLRSGVGFGRGFDSFSDTLEAPASSLVITNLQTVGVPSRQGERISEEFGLWLDARADDRPFFAWLHYYDPHWPYRAGAGYAELYVDQPYAGEVAYMDDCVGSVLRALDRHGLSESTGLVAVADHGEGLGDHGEPTHALLLYNATLRVPLIARFPWIEQQRPRVATAVSNADVAPTILDALGHPPDSLGLPFQGRSLLPLLRPANEGATDHQLEDRPLYFETFYPYHHYRWSPLSGFVSGERKFIHGPQDELFDLGSDMGESHPIGSPEDLARERERLARLDAELRRGRPEASQHELDREQLAQLQALGYAAGGIGIDAEELVDLSALTHPRASFDVFDRYNQISGLMQQQRIAEALEIAQSIAAADPRQKEARLMAATFAARLNRLDTADRAFAELARDFPDKDVVFQAGSYFLNRGQLGQARQCFERLVAADAGDVESLTRLARIAVAESAPDEARRLLEQALAVDPTYRESLVALAVLLDRQGMPEARHHFETAAARYPFDPEVNFDYGVFLLRHARDREGLERLQRAATLSSGGLFAAAHFALASHFEQRGDLEQARAHLRQVVLDTDDPSALRQAQAKLAELGGG